MNKLEERHEQITYDFKDEAAGKHATITKEIAIGFSKWLSIVEWGWSEDHEIFLHESGKFQGKTGEELFEMYLDTLK